MKAKIPPPVWLLVFGAMMWFVAKSAFAYTVGIPYSGAIALVIGFAGIFCAGAGLREFSKASTTTNPLKPEEASTLVTSGVYKTTRNPMYVGLFIILTGWAVWLGSVSNLLLLIVFASVMTEMQIKPEEKALQELFGRAYDDYCRQVRRWL